MDTITKVNDALWAIGRQRAEVIRPLAEQRKCSRAVIMEASQILQVSERYVYRLIMESRKSEGLLTALMPQKPSGGQGKSRLPNTQASLIDTVIEQVYLTPQKLIPARIVEEIRKRCAEQSIEPPSEATIRRRLQALSKVRLTVRGENTTALDPIVGSFPEVDYPLSVIQMDHTPVDIILVDPIDRLPIGRPYLTVAIDVYSRCIAGFLLSLEAPSAVSVGLCLTHVAMEKAPWLTLHNIEASWPIHGKPRVMHIDNAPEFHSAALTRGCEQHGIRLDYRPLGQPQYGGMVERMIGTLMQLVHTLPGTTFSNVTERGDYDADKKACLTLAELEHWLTIAITQYYHAKLHSGIQQTPLKLYESGLAKMQAAQEDLARIHNSKAFFIDFLPIEYRTLRRDGFMLDHITYYSHGLRSLIPERGTYGKFLIRRDPRDLSRIYVHIPENSGYLEVPYRIASHPAISLFEHRMALKRLKDTGKEQVQEATLFKAIDEMRNLVKTATSTTRKMRRNRTRIHENQKVQPPTKVKDSPIADTEEGVVKAFTDIEVWE